MRAGSGTNDSTLASHLISDYPQGYYLLKGKGIQGLNVTLIYLVGAIALAKFKPVEEITKRELGEVPLASSIF
jgi:hypothetical protein